MSSGSSPHRLGKLVPQYRLPCQFIVATGLLAFAAHPLTAYGADEICQGFFRVVNPSGANTNQVKVHAEPSEAAPVVAVLQQGAEVLFDAGDRTGRWANIVLTQNRMGWVRSDLLKRPGYLPNTNTGFFKVKTLDGDSVNLRSKPGYGPTIVGTLPPGSRVRLIQAEGEWWIVTTTSGETGYVKANYLICD